MIYELDINCVDDVSISRREDPNRVTLTVRDMDGAELEINLWPDLRTDAHKIEVLLEEDV